MPNASNRLRKQAKKVSKELHKMNGTVRDAAHEKLREISKAGSERYEDGRSKVLRVERRLVHMIQRRPFRFALIATTVGVLLGGLWFRRSVLSRARTKDAI